MLKQRNFGRKSLKEIEDILHDMGLHFGMDVSDALGPREPEEELMGSPEVEEEMADKPADAGLAPTE